MMFIFIISKILKKKTIFLRLVILKADFELVVTVKYGDTGLSFFKLIFLYSFVITFWLLIFIPLFFSTSTHVSVIFLTYKSRDDGRWNLSRQGAPNFVVFNWQSINNIKNGTTLALRTILIKSNALILSSCQTVMAIIEPEC